MARDNSSFYVLLGILDGGARSGYDIKKTMEFEIGHYFKISNGQIYPALKKLVQMEYATVTVEENDGKPDRKVYEITEKGRASFRQWLMKPVDYHNPSGNELLLKLYFGSMADIGHSMGLITDFMAKKKSLNDAYDKISSDFNLDTISNLPQAYSYLTLRYGQILSQANVAWCREAIGLLDDIQTHGIPINGTHPKAINKF